MNTLSVWLKALNTPHADQRKEAILALRTLDHPDAIPALVEIMYYDDQPELQDLAAQTLRQVSRPENTRSPRDPYGQFRL